MRIESQAAHPAMLPPPRDSFALFHVSRSVIISGKDTVTAVRFQAFFSYCFSDPFSKFYPFSYSRSQPAGCILEQADTMQREESRTFHK